MKTLFAGILLGIPIVLVICLLLNAYGITAVVKRGGTAIFSLMLIILAMRELWLVWDSYMSGHLISMSRAGSSLVIDKNGHPIIFVLVLGAELICCAVLLFIGFVGLNTLRRKP